jgi:hypothetical protein
MTGVPEALLCQAYREEADHYTQALALAEDLSRALHEELGADAQLHTLAVHLDQVAVIEARIATTKQAWQKKGQKPGTELKKVLEQVAEQLERLARCLHGAEQEALRQKIALAPRLDSVIRGQQMRRAYREVRNTFTSKAER